MRPSFPFFPSNNSANSGKEKRENFSFEKLSFVSRDAGFSGFLLLLPFLQPQLFPRSLSSEEPQSQRGKERQQRRRGGGGGEEEKAIEVCSWRGGKIQWNLDISKLGLPKLLHYTVILIMLALMDNLELHTSYTGALPLSGPPTPKFCCTRVSG